MKRFWKQFTALFMAVLMVCGMILPLQPRAFAEGAGDTQKINLQVGAIIDKAFDTEKQEYYTNEPIAAGVNLDVSGAGVNIKNARLVVTVPKHTSIGNSLKFTDSMNAKKNEKSEDENNWYMTYTFEQLTGASTGTYSFPFKFDAKTTQLGETLTATAVLYDGSGKVIKRATHTYKAKVMEPESLLKNNFADQYDKERDVYMVNTTIDDTHPNTTDPGRGIRLHYVPAVYLNAENDTYKGMGQFYPDTITMVAHLPKEATLDAGALNGWKYDEATHTATFVFNKTNWPERNYWTNSLDGDYQSIFLNYKNAPVNKVYTLKMDYYLNKGEATEKQLASRELKAEFKPIPYGKGGGASITKSGHYYAGYNKDDTLDYWGGKNHRYYYLKDGYYIGDTDFSKEGMRSYIWLDATNNGTNTQDPTNGLWTEVKDITITLKDKRIYFAGFSMYDTERLNDGYPFKDTSRQTKLIEALNTVGNTLYGIRADGSKVELHKNLRLYDKEANPNSKVAIEDSKRQYVKLQLVFDKPIVVDNMRINFYEYTRMMDSEKKLWDEKNNGDLQTYRSHVEANVKRRDADEFKTMKDSGDNAYAYMSIVPLEPLFAVFLQSNESIVYQEGGTQFDYEVGPNLVTGNWGPLKEVTKTKSVTLLPPGYTCGKDENGKKLPLYKSATETLVNEKGDVSNWQDWKDFKESDIKVIENYKNTGRTAVIVDYGTVKYKESRKVILNLVATRLAPQGSADFENYYTYEDNTVIKPNTKETYYKDEMDLDEDGNTNEIFRKISNQMTFIPPYELILHKYVKYPSDPVAGLSTTGDLGYGIDYHISVLNETINPIKQLSILDTLPAKGDHVIAPNELGQYTARMSEFATPLRMAVEDYEPNKEIVELFDVYYQTVPQGSNLASVRDGVWLKKEQITDWSKVKSLRFALKAGKELSPKTEKVIVIPAKIPFDTKLKVGQKAVNTAAASRDNIQYAEGNRVSAQFVTYEVKGKVYYDVNKNGVYDKGLDKPISGAEIQLLDEKGKVATLPDANQTKITAKTDSDGNYSAKVYKRGVYQVSFTLDETHKKDLFEKGSASAGDILNKAGNSVAEIKEQTATSEKLKLNPSYRSSVQNAAVIGRNDIKVIKKDKDTKEPIQGVSFELLKEVQKNGTPVKEKVADLKTDEKGEGVFSNIEYGSYLLRETTAAKTYNNDNEKGKPLDLKDSSKEIKMEFFDSKIKGSVKVKKVDKEDTSLPLKGVKFALKQNGKTVYTAVTDKDGIAEFKEVVYGNYSLEEVETLPSYNLSKETKSVSVQKQGEVYDLGTVTNQKIKGEVKVQKVDKEDHSKKLKGVEFALMQGDKEVMTAITNEDGIAHFQKVIYGDYTLIEKTPLLPYVASDKKIAVEIREDGKVIDAGTVENKLKKGSVILKKVDADTKQPLKGVVFVLKQGDKEVYEATTDEEGIATFKDVVYGSYKLVEKSTLESHNLLKTELDIVIDSDGKAIDLGEVTNVIKRGSVRLTKVDEETPSKKLSDVTFALQKDGKTVSEAVTNKDGIAQFTGVSYGTYQVVETKARSGYILSEKPRSVTIKEEGQIVELGTVTNKMGKGTIHITKVDQNDKKKTLKGAEFTLLKGKKVFLKGITNEKGILEWSVPYGSYTVVETKSPVGYQKADRKTSVEIKKDGQTVSLEVKNKPIPDSVKGKVTPRTGDKKRIPMYIGIGIAALVLLTIVIRFKKK